MYIFRQNKQNSTSKNLFFTTMRFAKNELYHDKPFVKSIKDYFLKTHSRLIYFKPKTNKN